MRCLQFLSRDIKMHRFFSPADRSNKFLRELKMTSVLIGLL